MAADRTHAHAWSPPFVVNGERIQRCQNNCPTGEVRRAADRTDTDRHTKPAVEPLVRLAKAAYEQGYRHGRRAPLSVTRRTPDDPRSRTHRMRPPAPDHLA